MLSQRKVTMNKLDSIKRRIDSCVDDMVEHVPYYYDRFPESQQLVNGIMQRLTEVPGLIDGFIEKVGL